MKTIFELRLLSDTTHSGQIEIVGRNTRLTKTYVRIGISKDNNSREFVCACLKDNELEKFAVNLLKAIKSKRLKTV